MMYSYLSFFLLYEREASVSHFFESDVPFVSESCYYLKVVNEALLPNFVVLFSDAACIYTQSMEYAGQTNDLHHTSRS